MTELGLIIGVFIQWSVHDTNRNCFRVIIMIFLKGLIHLWNYFSGVWLGPYVETSTGVLQGRIESFQDDQVYQFLGIPYAQPPLDSLRFQRPVSKEPWYGVRDASRYGKACLQRNEDMSPEDMDEDCLFLNVFVKKETFENNKQQYQHRPVMIWIHGGGFMTGSGQGIFNGIPMVPMFDTILVTINYRLGPFGYAWFGDAEPRIAGNMGQWDQIEAIRWVKKNIRAFGGNPDSITIFGQSAGSIAVSLHIISPVSSGLFTKAIMQSGSMLFPQDITNEVVESQSCTMLSKTPCQGNTQILECLQSLDASTILNAASDKLMSFRPRYGEQSVPMSPQEAFATGNRPNWPGSVLLGAEKEEFALFLTKFNPTTFNPASPGPMDKESALQMMGMLFKPDKVPEMAEIYLNNGNISSPQFLPKQMIKLFGDVALVCPTVMFGLNMIDCQNCQAKMYAYLHTQKPASSTNKLCDSSPWYGACHSADLPHVFGRPFTQPQLYSDIDRSMSFRMMHIWAHFAATG